MTSLKLTPKTEIQSRIKEFQSGIEKSGIDGAIITHHINLFYLSGTSQSGHLFVPRQGDPILMIRKSHARAKQESPIDNTIELKSLKKIPDVLKSEGYTNLKTIGFELDVIPYNTCQMYMKIIEDSQIVDVSGIIKKNRLLKSSHEIDLLKEACGVIDSVFLDVPNMLQEGMTEVELASLFEGGMRKRGYSGCCRMRAFNQDFFMGNIVSGQSGAVPTYFDGPVGGTGLTPANKPHGAGWKKIKRNEIVYIDYTCVVNGYTADEARMFVIGDVSENLKNAHKTAISILKELVIAAKPDVECQDIYEKALTIATEMGYEDHFMGLFEDKVKFVGHGVGLELDEFPVFAKGVKLALKPGMTFALEPKFVFPEGAVGIENTYVMKKNGAEVLTHAPEDIIRL